MVNPADYISIGLPPKKNWIAAKICCAFIDQEATAFGFGDGKASRSNELALPNKLIRSLMPSTVSTISSAISTASSRMDVDLVPVMDVESFADRYQERW